jgi:hypothetical protein
MPLYLFSAAAPHSPDSTQRWIGSAPIIAPSHPLLRITRRPVFARPMETAPVTPIEEGVCYLARGRSFRTERAG